MQSRNSFVGTWSFSQEIVYSEFGGSIWSCLFFHAINVLLSLPSSTLLSDQWITGKKTRKTSYYLFFLLEVKTCWQLVNCNPSPSNDSRNYILICKMIFETVDDKSIEHCQNCLNIWSWVHIFTVSYTFNGYSVIRNSNIIWCKLQIFNASQTSKLVWFVSTVDTLLNSYCLCNESKVQSIALLAYLH